MVRERGELPLQQVLRCRVRYFSDGMAIGSRGCVNEGFRLHRGNFDPKRQEGARPMRFAAWVGLCVACDLRWRVREKGRTEVGEGESREYPRMGAGLRFCFVDSEKRKTAAL